MRRDTGTREIPGTGAPEADWKLVRPLHNAVTLGLVVLAAVMLAGLAGLTLDNHTTVFGLGYGPLCTDVPVSGLTVGGSGNGILAHLRPGTYQSYSARMAVCVNRPTAGQRTLVTLTGAPTYAFFATILLLLARLLRTVQRAGPFAEAVAHRLRFLGWFVLGGWLAVTVGQSVAQSYFAATVVTDPVPVIGNAVNAALAGMFPPLLIACGLLTLARVMRVGTRMSDDLAGTV